MWNFSLSIDFIKFKHLSNMDTDIYDTTQHSIDLHNHA